MIDYWCVATASHVALSARPPSISSWSSAAPMDVAALDSASDDRDRNSDRHDPPLPRAGTNSAGQRPSTRSSFNVCFKSIFITSQSVPVSTFLRGLVRPCAAPAADAATDLDLSRTALNLSVHPNLNAFHRQSNRTCLDGGRPIQGALNLPVAAIKSCAALPRKVRSEGQTIPEEINKLSKEARGCRCKKTAHINSESPNDDSGLLASTRFQSLQRPLSDPGGPSCRGELGGRGSPGQCRPSSSGGPQVAATSETRSIAVGQTHERIVRSTAVCISVQLTAPQLLTVLEACCALLLAAANNDLPCCWLSRW